LFVITETVELISSSSEFPKLFSPLPLATMKQWELWPNQ